MKITDKYYDELVSTIPGWMEKEKMEWFERCYSEIKQSTYEKKFIGVELGVFYGLSAIAQAIIIKELELPFKLICVDPWTARACAEGTQDEANRNWWNNQDYSKALQSFKSSVIRYGLLGIVDEWVKKSEDAAEDIRDNISVLHIDGNHSEEKSLLDVELYLPKVQKLGYIFMDDSRWPHTQEAVRKLNDNCYLLHEYDKDGRSWNVYQKK